MLESRSSSGLPALRPASLAVGLSCALLLSAVRAADAKRIQTAEEVSLEGLTCQADDTCAQKYKAWRILGQPVGHDCCVMVSCSDTNFFYTLSSGCASRHHCSLRDMRTDMGGQRHYAARMRMSYWRLIEKSATMIRYSSDIRRCEATAKLVDKLKETLNEHAADNKTKPPSDATPFSIQPLSLPEDTATGPIPESLNTAGQCVQRCPAERPVCCTRVICGMNSERNPRPIVFTATDECQEAECTHRVGTASFDARNPNRRVYWFEPPDWLERKAWESISPFSSSVPVYGSCDETSTYHSVLAKNKREEATAASDAASTLA